MSVFFKSGGSSSSAGQGVINLITNGIAANQAVNPFTTYADAAGPVPVDGTGGTPTGVTAGVTTTTPLIPPRSFTFTKDSGNQQGQGFSLVFPVELAYRGKSIEISVDYIIQSGTFNAGTLITDSDITWYVYDITNSQLIYPTNVKMFSNSSTVSDTFVGTFQTSATGASYRLIAHVGTTNTTDFVMALDYVTVTPNVNVNGAAISNFISYTPTGTWTNTTYTGKYRQVGDRIDIEVTCAVTGTPSGTGLVVSIPPQFTLSTSIGGDEPLGVVTILDAGVARYVGTCTRSGASTTELSVRYDAPVSTFIGSTSPVVPSTPFVIGTGDFVFIKAYNVAVNGLSASTRQSDGFSSRNITAVLTRITSAQAISSSAETKVQLNSALIDTTASFDLANNQWVCPVSDYYSVSGCVFGTLLTAAESIRARIKVNSSIVAIGDTIAQPGSDYAASVPAKTVFINAGQAVDLFVDSVVDSSYEVAASAVTFLSITRVQSPQTISASDEVSLIANTSSAQNNQNNTAVIVAYNTRELDTFNMLNTANGIMTAPVTGRYFVDAQAEFASNASLIRVLRVYVGSSFTIGGPVVQALGSNATTVTVSGFLNLTAGQTFSIQCFQNSGATLALTNAAFANRLNVRRITE